MLPTVNSATNKKQEKKTQAQRTSSKDFVDELVVRLNEVRLVRLQLQEKLSDFTQQLQSFRGDVSGHIVESYPLLLQERNHLDDDVAPT